MMRNSKLNLVKLSKTTRKIVSEGELLKDVVLFMGELSNIQELKNDKLNDLVKLVCELVENADYKAPTNELKMNKKELVIKALTIQFPELNNDLDKKRISDMIDFICESQLVKKASLLRWFKKCLWPVIKQKFF